MKRIISLLLCVALCLASISTYVSATDVNASEKLFSGGSGTAEDPYIISTADDFIEISNYPSSYFLQTSDISLSNISNYTPIGSSEDPFSGTYNGNGFKIIGLSIDTKELTYIGLFGYLAGTISNVIIEDFSIIGYSNTEIIYAGSLAGYSRGKIINCTVNADLSINVKYESSATYCGGICGYSRNYSISNCAFDGTAYAKASYVTSNAYCGGICGYGWADNCINMGTVSAEGSSSTNAYAGGISARTTSHIQNCFNSGSISATVAAIAYAGGIVGYGSAVTGCKNTGTVYGNSQYTYPSTMLWDDTFSGGISGYNNGTISFCENTGTIHADSSTELVIVGGIAGMNSSVIQDSKNSGYVYCETSGRETRVGGIAGSSYSGSYVKRCCNTGTVEGCGNRIFNVGHSGGIVGCLQYGTIMQCCNHGSISIISEEYVPEVGGIAGSQSGTLIDCYNDGDVSIDFISSDSRDFGYCGGICGSSSTMISYCYNIGSLTSKTTAGQLGGITGNNSSDVENCYTTNAYSDLYAVVMTNEEAIEKDTYAGFDFDDVWAIDESINEGKPYLITLPSCDDSNWYEDPTETIPVTGIQLDVDSLVLSDGDSNSLKATVFPGNADNRKVIWSTNDASVAIISAAGKVTAISSGTAVITVTTEDGGYTASCTVTVAARSAEEYKINSITVRDNDGAVLSAIPNGDCLATVSITNLESEGNTLVFLAAYTSTGQYRGMMWVSVEDLPVGATIKVTLPVDNSDGKIENLKAFTVASFSNLTPLGETVSFLP